VECLGTIIAVVECSGRILEAAKGKFPITFGFNGMEWWRLMKVGFLSAKSSL
jgi:hypothetical protein